MVDSAAAFTRFDENYTFFVVGRFGTRHPLTTFGRHTLTTISRHPSDCVCLGRLRLRLQVQVQVRLRKCDCDCDCDG